MLTPENLNEAKRNVNFTGREKPFLIAYNKIELKWTYKTTQQVTHSESVMNIKEQVKLVEWFNINHTTTLLMTELNVLKYTNMQKVQLNMDSILIQITWELQLVSDINQIYFN